MTPAGKRRERPIFQQKAIDENGDRLGPWEEGFSRSARIVPRTRGEIALQQRMQGIQLVEVTVPRDSATQEITSAWRMVWHGTPYNIQASTPSESRREMNILAQADQSDA